MFKQIVLAGSAAAVVLGAGTAALAASAASDSTPAATPSSQPAAPGSTAPNSSASKSKPAKGHKAKAANGPLRNALHAQWVTRAGKGSTGFVTHDAIRGQVTAVSATSITVKAADNVSQTYAVTSATKVHTRAEAKGKSGTISEVHSGDRVVVSGTGTSTFTAVHIADGAKK
jgi:hypothetical protein